MKKCLLVLMVIVLTVSVATAFTEESGRLEESGVDFKYYIMSDGTAQIVEYTGSAKNLVLPEKLDGHPVTHIGDQAFRKCYSLVTVVIPDSVTSIGENAFSGCGNLTSIAIPDSVTRIGETAFNNCSKLNATVSRDSYALEYCMANGVNYVISD